MKIDDRRDFLKKSIKVFFSLLCAASLSVLAYVYPSKTKKKEIQSIYLLDEEELPKKGVKKIVYKYKSNDTLITNRIFLVANNNSITAFSPVCTHFGCLVNWDSNKKIFICPCHGGKYDIYGNVISGPPPKPLMRLPLRIIDGKVYVDVLL